MPTPARKNPKQAVTMNQRGMDFLETASLVANVAVVVFGVLAAVAGGFALYFNSRLSALKDAQVLELRQRVKPRTVTTDQRTRLIEALRLVPEKGAVGVLCPLGDGEACTFAFQISSVLQAAGWPVKDAGQGGYAGVGIWLSVCDGPVVPRYAVALQQIFDAVGIPLPGAKDPTFKMDTVQIRVGTKP